MSPTDATDQHTRIRGERSWQHLADGTFHKTMSTHRAEGEYQGWRALRGLAPVPHLLRRRHNGSRTTLIYEDVFASGRCTHLLADLLTEADADPARIPAIRALIDAVCDSWQESHDRTGRLTPLHATVPALYATRLNPGGRLERWYGRARPCTVHIPTGSYRLDLPALLTRLRTQLPPGSLWPSMISQGDPTEPNIAGGPSLCWLDLEHAGRTTVAGEVANLLAYLLFFGGWLVPAYQPGTYARTVRRRAIAVDRPHVRHLHITGGRIDVDASLCAGPGRRTALDALLERLNGDLGRLLTPPGHDSATMHAPARAPGPATVLAPWLALRILGVVPLASLSPSDGAICLAELGRILDPSLSLTDLATTLPSGPDHAQADTSPR
ncbi:hypothetical protein FXF51_24185 [Nonomuraea sp. PA05]|uniref:hypothetical protein n=1 Tax=Nonomuraea sp. PA05 TaxID=2604466 RepID=UPI0011D3C2F3|nr:hypothetical protein [Nonomuraea sp. PA05]TYB63287.1 hypothetical protein FXF51_24185 [Nonomuraea sp. PA05]